MSRNGERVAGNAPGDSDVLSTAVERARAIIDSCSTPSGIYAAGATDDSLERGDHYRSIWARDAAFAILGLAGAHELSEVPAHVARRVAAQASLETLARHQFPSGQIPTVVWEHGYDGKGEPYADCGETGGIDSVSLFVIAAAACATLEIPLSERVVAAIAPALTWLVARDSNQTGLIDSPPSGDWMDSTLSRSGKTLYNNVLLAQALSCAHLVDGRDKEHRAALALDLRDRINVAFWPTSDVEWGYMVRPLGTTVRTPAPFFPHPATAAAYRAAINESRTNYLSHIVYAEFVDQCDCLGNILTALFDIAPPERAAAVLTHIGAAYATMPAPGATLLTSVSAQDPSGTYRAHVDPYQGPRWRNPPGSYHNGGIWPFIGGLFIVAARKATPDIDASAHLQSLARCCLDTDFCEWVDPISGRTEGNTAQAWSAAMFLYAHAVTHPA